MKPLKLRFDSEDRKATKTSAIFNPSEKFHLFSFNTLIVVIENFQKFQLLNSQSYPKFQGKYLQHVLSHQTLNQDWVSPSRTHCTF